MELLDVRLIGVNAETGQKLLLTIGFVVTVLLLRAAAVKLVHVTTGRHRNERLMFWVRQAASAMVAIVSLTAVLSIWFDDPQRLATGLGIFGAGLALRCNASSPRSPVIS